MHLRELRYFVLSDLYRLTGNASWGSWLKMMLRGDSYPYIFWMRVGAYLRAGKLRRHLLFPWVWWILRHLSYRLGISISSSTRIGSGFYIGHFSGIIVNSRCIIGRNCNLSPGVVLGQVSRGKMQGTPVLGDNVYVGPGAKIVGAVHIGNDVAIGANCVVTKDVPDHSVVVGIPGKVISSDGSAEYILHTDYDRILRQR